MYVLSHLRGGDTMSVPLEIAKKSDGKTITTLGQVGNSQLGVALWTAGSKKFLILERAKSLIGYEELPRHTTLPQAIQLQELKLMSLEGGKA